MARHVLTGRNIHVQESKINIKSNCDIKRAKSHCYWRLSASFNQSRAINTYGLINNFRYITTRVLSHK